MNVSDQNPKLESHAFAVMNSQAFKSKKGAGQRCTHCNRDDHLREGYWVLYPHLKPKWKGQGGGSGRSQGEPQRKAYLAETLDSSQEETKRTGSIRGDGSTQAQTQAQLNRLESSVNRLSALLGQQGLMGQSGLIFAPCLFKSHDHLSRSGFMESPIKNVSFFTSPVQSNMDLCKAQQCTDKSPVGQISLKGLSESKTGLINV
jgi:hypothetical protein